MNNKEWLLNGLSLERYNKEQTQKNNYYDYLEIWNKINKLDFFTRQMFYYKFDFYFNKIRSNKHISELMCCSEENVRKNLVKTIIKITKN
jgi:hypothetical protein